MHGHSFSLYICGSYTYGWDDGQCFRDGTAECVHVPTIRRSLACLSTSASHWSVDLRHIL